MGKVFKKKKKSPDKLLRLSFSSLDWGFVSVAKTASVKIGAVIHSMKFLSPEGARYL